MNTPPPAAHAPHSSKASPAEQSTEPNQSKRTASRTAAGLHQHYCRSDAARCRRRATSTQQTQPREVRRPQRCGSAGPHHGELDTAGTARAEPTQRDTRHASAVARQGVGGRLSPIAGEPVPHSKPQSMHTGALFLRTIPEEVP